MNTLDKMTTEDIQVWISFLVNKRARTWFKETTDITEWEDFASGNVPYSDYNSAKELYRVFADLVHYLPESKSWHVWNGIFHEKIEGDFLAYWMCTTFVEEHKRAIDKVKEHYSAQMSVLAKDERAAKYKEYAKTKFGDHRAYRDKLHSNSGLTSLSSQVKNEFSVASSFFDDDRRWLVLNNGVIDLRELRENPPLPGDLSSIKLLEHNPSRPVWRQVNADLDPWATCDRWRSFMETSQPAADMRKFLAALTGASLLAESKVKVVPVLKGPPNSGKTVYVSTIERLVGGYGHQPSASIVTKSQGQNFSQSACRGIRFVGISEPDPDRKVDDTFVKQFTGGDIVTTRNLHERDQGWISQGILFISSNTDLKMNTSDRAILERFATVRFPHQFHPKGQVPKGRELYTQDPTLDFALELEADGILSWILNGMLVYLNEGLVIPEAVHQDRNQLYVQGSSVFTWAEEVLKQGKTEFAYFEGTMPQQNHYAAISDVYIEYSRWCMMVEGVTEETKRKFSQEMQTYLDMESARLSGSKRFTKVVYKEFMPIQHPSTDDL